MTIQFDSNDQTIMYMDISDYTKKEAENDAGNFEKAGFEVWIQRVRDMIWLICKRLPKPDEIYEDITDYSFTKETEKRLEELGDNYDCRVKEISGRTWLIAKRRREV